MFQSGSIGSCEKQSDVFHHIRYAGSPRASIPHKSIEIPKPLLSLEDYKEAEAKLEKRLLSHGYGSSNAIISRIAKGIKAFLFFFFYIPYYLTLRLPLMVVSLGLGFCKTLFLSVYRPVLRFISLVVNKVRGWKLGLNLTAFKSFFAKYALAKSQKEEKASERKDQVIDAIAFEEELAAKEQKKKELFWNRWAFPTINLPKFNLNILKFSFPKGLKSRLKFSFPRIQWNLKGWLPTLPQWKINFKDWQLPRWKWANPVAFFSGRLIKPRWKLPRWTFNELNLAVRQMKNKILVKSIRWNFRPLLDSLKRFALRFRWRKEERTGRTRSKFKAAVGTVGDQIVEFLDGLVSFLPELPQETLRGVGRGFAWVFQGLFDVVRRSTLFAWRMAVKVFSTLIKVQENIQKITTFTNKVQLKTKTLAIKGVDMASKPVVRAIEKTHSAAIPIRLQLRRWTFLAGILVELSVLMLGEAIVQFEQWNNEKFASIRF